MGHRGDGKASRIRDIPDRHRPDLHHCIAQSIWQLTWNIMEYGPFTVKMSRPVHPFSGICSFTAQILAGSGLWIPQLGLGDTR